MPVGLFSFPYLLNAKPLSNRVSTVLKGGSGNAYNYHFRAI